MWHVSHCTQVYILQKYFSCSFAINHELSKAAAHDDADSSVIGVASGHLVERCYRVAEEMCRCSDVSMYLTALACITLINKRYKSQLKDDTFSFFRLVHYFTVHVLDEV